MSRRRPRAESSTLATRKINLVYHSTSFDNQDPLWSARVLADDPDSVKAVHRLYYDAGVALGTSFFSSATILQQRSFVFQHSAFLQLLLPEGPVTVSHVFEFKMWGAGDRSLCCLLTGADVGTTCSYQATHDGFVKAGFSRPEADELFRRSIRLASAARDDFWSAHQSQVRTPDALFAITGQCQ